MIYVLPVLAFVPYGAIEIKTFLDISSLVEQVTNVLFQQEVVVALDIILCILMHFSIHGNCISLGTSNNVMAEFFMETAYHCY